MLVFIDESGDTGLKLNTGSSRFFVIGLVSFANGSDAQKAQEALTELKNTLHKKYEFKFSKTKRDVKPLFFNAIKDCNFSAEALVIDKKQSIFKEQDFKTGDLYNYYLGILLKNSSISDANIVLDGEKGDDFLKKQKTYLRRVLPNGKLIKIRLKNSESDILIQMADMIIGAIACKYTDDNQEFYDIIKNKILKIWDM